MQTLLQSLKNNVFVQNVARVFGMKGIVLVLSMASSIVSARILGPEGKGAFAVAAALTGMGVQFGNLGMHASNTYYLARDKKLLPVVIGNSMGITLLVTIVSGGIFIVFWCFPQLVTIRGSLLFLSFLCIPMQLYNMYQENYFVALDRIKKYSVLELLNGILYPIFLIVAALLGGLLDWRLSPEAAVFLSALGTSMVVLVGSLFLKRDLKSKIRLNGRVLFEMLPFGFKSYLSCLITYLVLRVDVLMLDTFLNKEETGLYSLAVNLADIVNMLSVAVAMLLFPKLSGMSEEEERRKFIWNTLKYMSGMMFVLIIGATILSEIGVLWVYGEAYHGSVPVFRILMPGIFFWALSSMLFNYFSSENRIGVNISSSLLGLVVNLILNWILIPEKGIQGAALASTVAYILIFLLLMYYLIKAEKEYHEKKV